MDNKEQTLQEFGNKAREILDHSSDIETLHFDARLKNGTRFTFNFDEESFLRQKRVRQPYHPTSVFNGVLDILGSLIAIVLLIFSALHLTHPSGLTNTIETTTFSFFIVLFVVSATYNLFDTTGRTAKVLYAVRFGFLTACFALIAVTLSLVVSAEAYAFFAILVLLAACLFFSSIGTRAGHRAAFFTLALFALIPFLLSAKHITNGCLLFFMLATGAIPGLIPGGRDDPHFKVTSNSIFALSALIAFTAVLTQTPAFS